MNRIFYVWYRASKSSLQQSCADNLIGCNNECTYEASILVKLGHFDLVIDFSCIWRFGVLFSVVSAIARTGVAVGEYTRM